MINHLSSLFSTWLHHAAFRVKQCTRVGTEVTIQGACRMQRASGIHQISAFSSYHFYMRIFSSGRAMGKTDAVSGNQKKKKKKIQLNKPMIGHFCCRQSQHLSHWEWGSVHQPSFLPACVPTTLGEPHWVPKVLQEQHRGACCATIRGLKLSAAGMKNLRLAVGALRAWEGFGEMQAT